MLKSFYQAADIANELSDNYIDIWQVKIGAVTRLPAHIRDSLTPGEREKASRFRFDRDRHRYACSHIALRMILAQRVGVDPGAIRFQTGLAGKPYLVNQPDIHFNMSQSGDCAMIAIARNREVGIDIQQLNELPSSMDIARNFYTPNEIVELEESAENQRLELFYRLWTRKEAFVKAIGEGLRFPLVHCEVLDKKDSDSSPVMVTDRFQHFAGYYFQDVAAPIGYSVSISTLGDDWEVSLHRSGIDFCSIPYCLDS